jgi:exosortase A
MKRDSLPFDDFRLVDVALRTAWQSALVTLTVVLIAILVAYSRTAASMIDTWGRSETFAHGFFVAPISLWLIWRKRDELRTMSPSPTWLFLPVMGIAGFGWLLGELGAVNALSQGALVTMVITAIATVLGVRITRALLFPLGFLLFMVPVGEFLLPTLMKWTADFTLLAVRASGVPVYREGMLLVLPTGRWSIVEACSGVRYLIASLMVGTLFAYLNYRAPWRRMVFVGIALVVPIIANWLRAYMIVMLGHLSNNRLAVGVDHLIYGWLFFGVVMLLMFWIGSLWAEPDAAHRTGIRVGIDPTGTTTRVAQWRVVSALLLAATAWPAAANWLERASGPTLVALTPVDVAGWNRREVEAASWHPAFARPTAVMHETLQRDDTSVNLYIAYYRGQNANHKLVSSDNALVPSESTTLMRIASGQRNARLGDVEVEIATAQIRGPDGKTFDAWSWYWIDGKLTSNDVAAKLLITWKRLLGRPDDAAAIVAYVATSDVRRSTETLQMFLREAWPAMETTLLRARGAS